LPAQIIVKAAYDVRGGNPFSRTNYSDFDLGSSAVTATVDGGQIVARQRDSITVRVDDDSFDLRVIGFDQHRDLIIDYREEKQ